MKKNSAIQLLIFLAVVIIAAAVPFYLLNYYGVNFKDLSRVAQQIPILNTAVEEIAPIISTPPPLRAGSKTPGAVLTPVGVLSWTNKARRDNGTQPLEVNSQLNAAAQAKVEDMFINQYFEHISPAGLGVDHWISQAGYVYIAVGENLALGNYESDQDLVDAWMNSPGHRRNILDQGFTQIGIAVKRGSFEGEQTWLAVQVFGKPRSSCPSVDENLGVKIEDNTRQLTDWQTQLENLSVRLKKEQPKGRASQEEIDSYNALVDQYNKLGEDYKVLAQQVKTMIDQYNQQMRAFNACAQGS